MEISPCQQGQSWGVLNENYFFCILLEASMNFTILLIALAWLCSLPLSEQCAVLENLFCIYSDLCSNLNSATGSDRNQFLEKYPFQKFFEYIVLVIQCFGE